MGLKSPKRSDLLLPVQYGFLTSVPAINCSLDYLSVSFINWAITDISYELKDQLSDLCYANL